MYNGGEAAEQIVRMSLEGAEVVARISGSGAKNVAALLYAVLKEEKKTMGQARLTNMLRSGKELKVFTVKNSDIKTFTREAKKYGVLYCVLADRKNKSPNAEVDIIARAEDASKINRIVERFHLSTKDSAEIVSDIERDKEKTGNPFWDGRTKKLPSENSLDWQEGNLGHSEPKKEKPSVREQIRTMREERKKEQQTPEQEITRKSPNGETKHQQPNNRKKRKKSKGGRES